MKGNGINPGFTTVLSAGRTGTVFLTHWINARAGREVAVHEPPFSRPFYLLGNLFAYRGWNRAALVRLYMAMRKRRIDNVAGYIELNPFLCPVADLLADIPYLMKVAHLVRDPRTWVPSLIAHEASGRRKFLTRHTPFNQPRDRQLERKWDTLTLVEKMLWRWSAFNRRISALENRDCAYEWFRYEDLFSDQAKTRTASRDRLARFLGLPPGAAAGDSLPSGTYNASDKDPRFAFANWSQQEIAFMQDVAGEQMSRYQYP